MDTPLTCWYCDVCRQPIERAADGYVIWKSNTEGDGKDHSFKLVHQGKCDLKDHGLSAALTDYLGHDGLAKLTAMLSTGPVMSQPTNGVRSLDEWVDLVRRLQTPHYEEARRRFHEEQIRDDLADSNELYPYMQVPLKSIIQR